MWHEARRQERKIRGMLVDYRRRAERRRDFYEKIKADPTQFLQVHGRQCKIHLDPNVAAAADSAVMMPWQGNADNLIDRFDVRAHLDYISPVKKDDETEITQEERQLNYERYRIIAQNSFLGITEEKFLKQLHLEEQFGYTESKGKKDQKTGGAAIGFNYEDGTGVSHTATQEQDEESDDNSDSDLDVDLAINVSKMDPAQAHEMNKHGRNFGMSSNDFYSFLTNDLEEAESYKLAKEEEQEKALFSGRRSRRERRYHREKRLANRKISPPSYAAQASPTLPILRDSKSASRSPTPDNTGKITYITSFGEDEDPPSTSKPTYADKVKYGKPKQKFETSSERIVYKKRSRSNSRDCFSRKRGSPRKRSRSRGRRSSSTFKNRRTRSPTRSRSKSPSKGRRSNSRSRVRRSKSRSRSRRSTSRSKGRRSRSKSRSRRRNWKSSSRSHSRSRSTSKSRFVRSFRRKRSSSSSSSSSSSESEKSKISIKQKSLSPERHQSVSPIKELEPPPKILPRYYGRKRSDESSSEISDVDEQVDEEMKPAYNAVGTDSKTGHGNNSGTATKKASTSMTVIERLKRKRQALLNRQFKADKIAEQLKTEREKQEQQTREDELREMAIRLRRRQRELRHAYDSRSSSSSDSDTSQRSNPSENRHRESREPSKEHDTEKRRDREKDARDRVRSRERDRSKDRGRSRDKDRSRDRDRNRSRERDRRGRDRDRYRDGRRDDDKRTRTPPRYRDRKSEDKGERKAKALVDY